MFRIDSDQDAAFRAEVRGWLESNVPADICNTTFRPDPEKLRAWHGKLDSRGWAALHWPAEWGGGGTLDQQLVFFEEMARLGAPLPFALALNFLAPALMAYGTAEQKNEHLPKIRSGERYFGQGYSEPNSGSDLASLQTKAVLDGDHYIINGQKIWNTWSHHADWLFVLVRTDSTATPKQAGISLILMDAKTPGITIQPIDNIADEDELATIFFDDVRVPAENIVGELGGGWKVANHVLSFERFNTGNPLHNRLALDRLTRVATWTGKMDDAAFRDKLADLQIEFLAQEAVFAHAIEIHNSGRILGPDSSIMKIVGTELLQRIADLVNEACGGEIAAWQLKDTGDGSVVEATQLFLQCRRATIYGGSSEIQRNVTAKRVLNLPV